VLTGSGTVANDVLILGVVAALYYTGSLLSQWIASQRETDRALPRAKARVARTSVSVYRLTAGFCVCLAILRIVAALLAS
jgi:predicted glycosyltransferase